MRVSSSGGERARASRVAIREVWEGGFVGGRVGGAGNGGVGGCLGRWRRLLRVRLSFAGIEARELKEVACV